MSKIRVRLVLSNVFKPSSNFLTVPRRCFFCGCYLLFVFHVCLCYTVLSVPYSLVVTCWERADLLAFLWLMCSCVFVTFSYGVLGQVWYLIVSIPDLCHLPYSLIFAFFLTYIEKTKKNIFLFQTTRPTDLIFGKVVLYQICSNNGSVAKGSHLYSENKQSLVNHLVGRFMFERIHSTKEGRNIEQKSGCLSYSKT